MDIEALWTPNVSTKLQSISLFQQNTIKRIVLSDTAQYSAKYHFHVHFKFCYIYIYISIHENIKFEDQYWFNITKTEEDRQNVGQYILFWYTC